MNFLKSVKLIYLYVTCLKKVLGYYHGETNYDFIFINESISDCESLYRTILAEEIGHYFTTIGDCTPKKHLCYSK